jgi:hypothetical protein
MTHIKLFLRKYWYIVVGAVLVLVLLARRSVILRNISRLRAKLLASQRNLEEIEHQRAVATAETAIKTYEAQATAARAEIAATQVAIGELHEEYAATTGRINTARSWEDLEKLREEGNRR